MKPETAYFVIKKLLNLSQVEQITTLFNNDDIFENGKSTASHSAREVKNNLQMNSQNQQYMAIQQIILSALNQNSLFRNAVLPKHPYQDTIVQTADGYFSGSKLFTMGIKETERFINRDLTTINNY